MLWRRAEDREVLGTSCEKSDRVWRIQHCLELYFNKLDSVIRLFQYCAVLEIGELCPHFLVSNHF
jgi:hypothetical protein